MTSARHDALTLVPLGSGSSGNATWIGDEHQGVLIDCGVSTKQILARLDACGAAGASIDAVLLTHEHEDHVGAVGVLDRRLAKERGEPVPFYMTQGTYDALPEERRPQRVELVPSGARVPWRGWVLEAHAVPHDTAAPVAWAVEAGLARVGVITDLGHAPRNVERLLASLDVAVLEFNHDETMLLDGPYPWSLKQRIRGRHGHLSNRQAVSLLAAARPQRLQHLLLAHLSDENNAPEVALEAAHEAVHHLGRPVQVSVAVQRAASAPVRVQQPSGTLPLAPAPRVLPAQASLFDEPEA